MSLGLPKSEPAMQGDADFERPNFILYTVVLPVRIKSSKPRPFDFGIASIIQVSKLRKWKIKKGSNSRP